MPRASRDAHGVAALVSRHCGSSCEPFLLEARKSSKVLLFGEPSYGSLDSSNLGEHPLPSGATAWIPTPRSRRLPEGPIDHIGVQPDVPIDPARFDAAQRAELLRWVSAVLDDPALASAPPAAVTARRRAVRRRRAADGSADSPAGPQDLQRPQRHARGGPAPARMQAPAAD